MTTNPPTYTMQHSRFDYFDKTVLSLSVEWRFPIILSYSNMMLCKPYKLSTPETIETIVKTWRYDKTDFYHTLGIDAYVSESSYIGNSISTLRGFLPVTDMNIQSLYRYNFATSEWDVPETFHNPYDNQYDYYLFFHAFQVWIDWPDNVSRFAYVFTNPYYQQRAVVKFNNSGFTCYATDTWWDVSSWQLVQNTQLIDSSLQNKKFYICDKAPTGSSGGPWVGSESSPSGNLWWPYPEFEYSNGIHEIDTSFSPYIDEVSAMDFYMSPSYVFMHVDETNGFYIQNFLVVRKVEENASIVPSIYIQQNVLSLMQGSSLYLTEGYIGNVIYTDDGKMIHTLTQYRPNNRDLNVASGVHLFITDLSLPTNEINQSTQYIDTTTTFTDTQVSINGNYQIHSISNYIVINMTNNDNHNQAVVVNTSTSTCELIPFRVNRIRKRFGTKHIVCDPSNELNKWTIYDIENKEIVDEFEIPSDYVTSTYFAFEDWVYIKCKYGSNNAMLLHTISTNTTEQISFPAELFNTNTSYGGFSYGTCDSSYTSYLNDPQYYYYLTSLYPNRIQYKDGICVLNSRYPNYVNGKIMVISRYNPKHIIAQSVIGGYNFYSYRHESAICLSKIYENYYLSFTMMYSSYGNHYYSRLIDIGRLVREDAEVSSDTSSIEYLVDYAPCNRDGFEVEHIFIPYKNKIYVYENNSNYNVRVLPPEGFITHKLTFTTKTCCRWNNPKQITYPTIQITLTNNV